MQDFHAEFSFCSECCQIENQLGDQEKGSKLISLTLNYRFEIMKVDFS
jgi:hypothetical protein